MVTHTFCYRYLVNRAITYKPSLPGLQTAILSLPFSSQWRTIANSSAASTTPCPSDDLSSGSEESGHLALNISESPSVPVPASFSRRRSAMAHWLRARPQ